MFIDCRKLCGAYLFLLFACEHASTLQSTQLVIGVMFTDGCDRNTAKLVWAYINLLNTFNHVLWLNIALLEIQAWRSIKIKTIDTWWNVFDKGWLSKRKYQPPTIAQIRGRFGKRPKFFLHPSLINKTENPSKDALDKTEIFSKKTDDHQCKKC